MWYCGNSFYDGFWRYVTSCRFSSLRLRTSMISAYCVASMLIRLNVLLIFITWNLSFVSKLFIAWTLQDLCISYPPRTGSRIKIVHIKTHLPWVPYTKMAPPNKFWKHFELPIFLMVCLSHYLKFPWELH